MPISTGKQRVRTFESMLRDVKYLKADGRRPRRFDPRTVDRDIAQKYIDYPNDKGSYNYDC